MFFQELIRTATPFIWTIAGIFTLSLIIQLFYYLFPYGRILRHKLPQPEPGDIPVSVIICARNEAENLAQNLPSILEQDYPDYEVIVVNDSSTDHSEDLLMEMKSRYPHLRYTSIPPDRKFTHGKKLAVTIGIKAARNEHLLFTDADCYPVSASWIRHMITPFNEKIRLVLGVGKYKKRRGLLNILVRYETIITAMQYLGAALGRRAYMGVGRNLAYTKSLFYDTNGFTSHLKVRSGDDDLFVNEAAKRNNTAVQFHPESLTISEPPARFGTWIKQKRRHFTTGKYYRAGSRWRLGTELISRIFFYGTLIALLWVDSWWYVALAAGLVQSILKMAVLKAVMVRLNEKDLLLPSFLLEPLMPLILGAIRIMNLKSRGEPKWS